MGAAREPSEPSEPSLSDRASLSCVSGEGLFETAASHTIVEASRSKVSGVRLRLIFIVATDTAQQGAEDRGGPERRVGDDVDTSKKQTGDLKT